MLHGKFGDMRVIVTGNTGYVGSRIGSILRPLATELVGIDTGFFAQNLTAAKILPEVVFDRHIWSDLRNFDMNYLQGIDAVVHLAAISNDPMGNNFEEVTEEINTTASARLAVAAKQAGVRRFVFASSCSLYGTAESTPRVETDPLNPLTAYARSKASMEKVLNDLADSDFQTTCLRFPTACGMSPRLRLDLVLNDFVASAISTGTIQILSDGTPWRPLIDVADMGRAIAWGLTHNEGEPAIRVNVGSNECNYQVFQIAETVAQRLPGTKVVVSSDAAPDKRSYKVDFSLYERLAQGYLPKYSLTDSIDAVATGLRSMGFSDTDFRDSGLIRLVSLKNLKKSSNLDDKLYWI